MKSSSSCLLLKHETKGLLLLGNVHEQAAVTCEDVPEAVALAPDNNKHSLLLLSGPACSESLPLLISTETSKDRVYDHSSRMLDSVSHR